MSITIDVKYDIRLIDVVFAILRIKSDPTGDLSREKILFYLEGKFKINGYSHDHEYSYLQGIYKGRYGVNWDSKYYFDFHQSSRDALTMFPELEGSE